MSSAIRVHGLRQLNRAFAKADKNLKKELTQTLKQVAEPVRADAARRTHLIRNVRSSSEAARDWSQMKTSAQTSMTYVAPRARRRGGSPRPHFGTLLMDMAMQPALDAHAAEVEHELGRMLDEIGRDWSQSG